MRRPARWILLASSLVAASKPTWKLDPRAAQQDADPGTYLPLPSYDPWYQAPEGWEAAKPGDLLRMRQHAYNMTPMPILNARDTFQLLFRSTDSHENATWGVTTVFLPTQATCDNSTSNCTQPILSYQLPYDTSCLDASPSFGLQWGEPYGEIAAALGRGWWVSVPDFEGCLASYGANRLAGRVVLDAVRAVVNASESYYGIGKTQVALWGYSNGASATDAAVEFAAEYAPHLRLAGAAIGGIAPNVGTAGPLLSGTQVAGLLVQGIIGVTSQYPAQRAYIISRMHETGPYNATEFFWASYMSGWQSLLYFSYVDVFAYFVGGRDDLDVPQMRDMFIREGVLGGFGVPNTPLFVYHAIEDDMTPVKDTDVLVQSFCEMGANILYHRNTWGGHNDELTNGRQRALDFLGDVLEGTKAIDVPLSGCRTVNLTYMHSPGMPIT